MGNFLLKYKKIDYKARTVQIQNRAKQAAADTISTS